MEQRKDIQVVEEADVASMGVLLGVIAAAFIALGMIIYVFGEDQSASMSAANNPPAQTERMVRPKPAPAAPAEPSTIGQGGKQ